MNEENKKEKTVYKLYATRTSERAIEALRNMKDGISAPRFTRITAKYMLIYSQNGQIMENVFPFIEYTIIGDKEVSRLSSADRDWLANCNFTIIAEEALKNKELVLQNMADALKVLEQELEKESAKVDAPNLERDE